MEHQKLPEAWLSEPAGWFFFSGFKETNQWVRNTFYDLYYLIYLGFRSGVESLRSLGYEVQAGAS
jgi:hypothetical protein